MRRMFCAVAGVLVAVIAKLRAARPEVAPTPPDRRNLRATHTAEIPCIFTDLRAPRVLPDASSPELGFASHERRTFAGTGTPMVLAPAVRTLSVDTLAFYDAAFGRPMAVVRGDRPVAA